MTSHDAHNQVQDPVCRMWIDPADAMQQIEHNGQTYYFCHEACVKWFQADPERYVGPNADQDAFARHHGEQAG